MKKRFDDNSEILLAISNAQELCYEKLEPLQELGIKLPTNVLVRVQRESYNCTNCV